MGLWSKTASKNGAKIEYAKKNYAEWNSRLWDRPKKRIRRSVDQRHGSTIAAGKKRSPFSRLVEKGRKLPGWPTTAMFNSGSGTGRFRMRAGYPRNGRSARPPLKRLIVQKWRRWGTPLEIPGTEAEVRGAAGAWTNRARYAHVLVRSASTQERLCPLLCFTGHFAVFRSVLIHCLQIGGRAASESAMRRIHRRLATVL